MKRFFSREKLFFLIILMSCFLLLFSIYYFSYYLFPDSYVNVIELKDSWNYYTDTDKNIKPLKKMGYDLGVQNNETLYLNIYLPSDYKPILLIKSYYQFIRVYLNDELVFENKQQEDRNKPGTALHFINVPKYSNPPLLRLEITSPYELYAGYPLPVYMGDTKALYGFILKEAMLHLFFLFICTSTGFILIFIFINFWIKNKKDRNNQLLSAFFFGLFSILWGFFCICRDNIIYLIFPPVTASLLAIGLHIIYFIPLMAYLYCYLTICKRVAKASLIIFCIIAVIAFILQGFQIVDFPDMLFLINPLQDLLFIPYFIIGFYEYKKGNSFVKYILPGALILIFTVIGTIVDFYIGNNGNRTELFINSTFCFILLIWIYYIRIFYQKRLEEKNEMKALILKNEMTIKNFSEIAGHMEEIRILRHEMNHHIGIIKVLCKEQDTSGIWKYINSAAIEYSATTIKYSNHILVDSILSTCFYRVRVSNIKIEHQISIPDILPMKDADLFSLLMNMLDNAIEAALEVPDTKDRFINLKILYKNQFLLITCKNSHNRKLHENEYKFFTTKKEADFHGYGIVIMKSIAKKYDSILDISYDTKEFCVKTVIPA